MENTAAVLCGCVGNACTQEFHTAGCTYNTQYLVAQQCRGHTRILSVAAMGMVDSTVKHHESARNTLVNKVWKLVLFKIQFSL